MFAIPSATLQQSLMSMAGQWLEPSVLKISTGEDWGTGFLLNNDGWIVTAKHVVGTTPTESIRVFQRANQNAITVEQVIRIHNDDVAFLKINATLLRNTNLGANNGRPNPLPLFTKSVSIGTADFLMLGYPATSEDQKQRGLQANIVSLYSADKSIRILPNGNSSTVTAARSGNSGGPICIGNGFVAAMVIEVFSDESARTEKVTDHIYADKIAQYAQAHRITYNETPLWNEKDAEYSLPTLGSSTSGDESAIDKVRRKRKQKEEDCQSAEAKFKKASEYIENSRSKGDLQEAESLLNEAIRLYPEFEGSYRKKSILLTQRNDINSALDYITKSIMLDSGEAESYVVRAYLRIKLRDNIGAISDCEYAMKLESPYGKAVFVRGMAKYAMGEYQDAIDDYSAALSLMKRSAFGFASSGLEASYGVTEYAMYFRRAMAYLRIGEYMLADNDITKSINYLEDNQAYALRAQIQLKLQNVDKALSDVNKSITMDTTYAKAYYTRALIYKALGKNNEVIADCKKAIDLSDSDVELMDIANLLRSVQNNSDLCLALRKANNRGSKEAATMLVTAHCK